jgi:hypothetical protein
MRINQEFNKWSYTHTGGDKTWQIPVLQLNASHHLGYAQKTEKRGQVREEKTNQILVILTCPSCFWNVGGNKKKSCVFFKVYVIPTVLTEIKFTTYAKIIPLQL